MTGACLSAIRGFVTYRRTGSSVTFGRVVSLALPAAAASAATPLLGVVDAWVLGRSSDPLQVGAVGLAAAIFSALYWTFGFLRMSSAGLAAQAVGGGDEAEARAVLVRSVAIGAMAGGVLLVLQPVIEPIAFGLLRTGSAASEATFATATAYFRIRMWAAPAALATYAATGWLTGRGRTAVAMASTIGMTVLNGALDWIFVVHGDLGAPGIALGTAIAEAAGLLFTGLGILVALAPAGIRAHWIKAWTWDPAAYRRLFATNRDIFIRTLLLVGSFAFFTQRSSGWGDVTLAANQILIQLFLLSGLALDGPAIACESLVGAAVVTKNRAAFRATVKYAGLASALAAAPFAIAYVLFGDAIVSGMTTSAPVAEAARAYMPWVAISPVVVALCFLLDGVFVGAAHGRDMRDAMITSVVIYLTGWVALTRAFGPHGHWAAFMLFFAVRGATLVLKIPRIEARLQQPDEVSPAL